MNALCVFNGNAKCVGSKIFNEIAKDGGGERDTE